MAVYHPLRVTCVCGKPFVTGVAFSVNAARNPSARQEILNGTFHRARCPGCKRWMTMETEFLYTDLPRRTFIKVNPPGERHASRAVSATLSRASDLVPRGLVPAGPRYLRVAFGLGELREKLIAQDAGFDDRVVELIKVYLVYEHPFLLRRPRLRLMLDRVTSTAMEFVACYDHDPQRFRIGVPRWVARDLIARSDDLVRWAADVHARIRRAAASSDRPTRAPAVGHFEAAAHQSEAIATDHWVNLWQWSPQPSVLDRLRLYAQQVEAGNDVDTTSADFQEMLRYLPRGAHLPAWAKQDLQVLLDYARKGRLDKVEALLLQVRFDTTLEDDWALNDDPDDIVTLWKLLKDLPSSNIDGNTYIHEIFLDEGDGGGFYSPESHDIHIGGSELSNAGHFENVVKHEVGHAVYEKFVTPVAAWLETHFGWKMFGTLDSDIDAWVALMGGWGDLDPTQQAQVRDYLRTAVGVGSSWQPGPPPDAPPKHPWNRSDFGPRLAYECTGDHWYDHHGEWYRKNGKAFFLNYWYQTFAAVDEATLQLVDRMPSSYASMSTFEFFAELYALYYSPDNPLRANIPATDALWLDQTIGTPATEPIAPARPEELPAWHWRDRPRDPPAN